MLSNPHPTAPTNPAHGPTVPHAIASAIYHRSSEIAPINGIFIIALRAQYNAVSSAIVVSFFVSIFSFNIIPPLVLLNRDDRI